jgi:hypothetical protein
MEGAYQLNDFIMDATSKLEIHIVEITIRLFLIFNSQVNSTFFGEKFSLL